MSRIACPTAARSRPRRRSPAAGCAYARDFVEGGLVEQVLRRDYPYDLNTAVQVIEDFAAEFEALIGTPVPRPFLPQALRDAA